MYGSKIERFLSLREKYSLSRYLKNFGVLIHFETIEIISSRIHTARIIMLFIMLLLFYLFYCCITLLLGITMMEDY